MSYSNPYNQEGAVGSSGSKTYNARDVKRGKVNPYDDWGASSSSDALAEQKRIRKQNEDDEKRRQQQRQNDIASKITEQQRIANQPKPKNIFQKAAGVISGGAKVTGNLAVGIVNDTKKAANTVITGVARTLPGGTADIEAEQRAAESAARARQTIKNLQKQNKISDKQAAKLYKGNAQASTEASKSTSNIYKALPSNHELAGSMAELGSIFVPGGGIEKIGSKVLPRLAARIAIKKGGDTASSAVVKAALRASREAPMGATYGGGQAATENKNVFKGAAEGVALVGGGAAGASLIRSGARGVKSLKPNLNPSKTAIINQEADKAAGRMKLGNKIIQEAKTTHVPVGGAENTVRGKVKTINSPAYHREANKLSKEYDKEVKALKGKGPIAQNVGQEQLDRKYQALREHLDESYGKTKITFDQPAKVNAVVHPELIKNKIVKPEIATVPSKSLKMGSDTLHTEIDKGTVAKYVKDLKEGNPISPVVISREKNGQILVQDGKHRLEAMKQAGIKDIPVVEKTTKAERANPFQEIQDKLPAGYKVDASGTVTNAAGKKLTSGEVQQLTQPKYLTEYENARNTGDTATVDRIASEHPNDARVNLESKPTKEGEIKTSGVAKSIEAKAIEKKLTTGFGDLAEFEGRNVKNQAEKVSKLITESPERMERIVTGQEALPEGMSGSMFIKGVEEYATNKGDVDLLRRLSQSSLTSETSLHASELRLLAEREPDSAVARMQELSRARTAAFEKRSKTSVAKTVQKTAADIKSKIKEPTKTDWNMFVESIKC